MTRVARNELDDARRLASRLESGQSGDSYNADYKAAIILLRAVGHKLSHVDGQVDSKAKSVIKQHFETRCRNNHYFNQLKNERDRLLKDEVAPLRQVCEKVETRAARMSMLHGPTDLGVPHRSHFKEVYRYFVTTGPFCGLEAADVLRRGITFWETELAWLESRLVSSTDSAISTVRRSATAIGRSRNEKPSSEKDVGIALATPSIAAALLAEMRQARMSGLSELEQLSCGANFVRFIAPGLEVEAAKKAVLSITCPTDMCEE